MHPERWLDIVRLRLRSLLRRNAVEQELSRELQFHLDQETEANLRRGSIPSEARSAAVRRLGGIAQIQEECRDTRGARYIDSFFRDLQYAVRMLSKAPAFALTATATLALGIGANTAIFQLLDALLLRTLPVAEPHRLAQIQIPGMNFGILEGADSLSYPLYREIRAHQQAFSDVFAWESGYSSLRLGEGTDTRQAAVLAVSGTFAAALAISPAAGRLFRPEDDFRGCAAPGVVLSYPFWQSEFGGSPSAVGSRLVVQGRSLEVLGVTPNGFAGPEVGPHFDLALPLCALSLVTGDASAFERRDYSWLNVIGRLKPGWTLAQASEHLRAISPSLMRDTLPSGYPPKALEQYLNFRLEAISGAMGVSRLREQYDRSLWLLLALTGLVLLIACANLSNLLLTRAAAREREFSIRLALGAGRGCLVRQTLTEGLVLASAGAILGLALASVISRAILRLLETDGGRLNLDLNPDWRVFAFAAAVTGVTCVLLSAAPALRAARGQAAEAMKAGARGLTMDRNRFALQRLLVVIQVSISVVLVAGAFVFVGSFRRLITMDPGFRTEGVLQARFDLGKQEHDETVLRQLLAEVRAAPQVESAAATTHFLIRSGMWSLIARTGAATRDARFLWVSPGFFATLGTPIREGRDFTPNDRKTSPKVAIVNERFARLFLPGANPIGKTFRTLAEPEYPEAEYEVVGLVRNTRYERLQAAEPPMAYIPNAQFPKAVVGSMMFIRSRAPLAGVEASVRRRIATWRPGTGMQFQAFEESIAGSLTRERLLAALTGFFGALAGLLAGIGLFGVLAYQAVRRRSEIGIRLALGATRWQIVQLVVTEAALLVIFGLVVGILGFLAVAQTAASLLFEISARDPLHLGAAVLTLATVAAIGSLLPAHQASRLDPMNALREE